MIDQLRVGMGFDVHALVEGRPLFLGGIQIPFEKGLEGHSDADALLHAIVDAILGALGEGDIGQHFSPSDPRWRGAPSIEFLRYAVQKMEKRGARLINLDSILMLERPKIAPHVPAIRELLAKELKVSLDKVHVKATTTEKLGFTGREEGIAAQAVCLLCLAPDNN